MKRFLERLLPPRGVEVRRLIGWVALGQGIAYLLLELLPFTLSISRYSSLISIMPLWAFGVLLLLGGVGLLWTLARRQRIEGRAVAVLVATAYGLYIGTFPPGALTAYVLYGLLTYALLGEASA